MSAIQSEDLRPDMDDLMIIDEDVDEGRKQISTREEWFRKRGALERIISDGLGGIPIPGESMRLDILDEVEEDGYTKKRIRYSPDNCGRDLTAYLLIPEGVSSPCPAAVNVHGTSWTGKDVNMGSPEKPDRTTAIELVKRGYVVLNPDLLGYGERIMPGSFHCGKPCGDHSLFYKMHPAWSNMGKNIFDLRLCVDILYSLDVVDKRRIACLGHSKGGHCTFYAAAFDPRISAAVASCALFPLRFREFAFRRSRQDGRSCEYFPKLRDYLLCGKQSPWDFHEVISLIAPRSFMNISTNETPGGLLFEPYTSHWEKIVSLVREQVEPVWKLFGAENKLAWHYYEGPHDFPGPVRELAYKWLDEQLDLS